MFSMAPVGLAISFAGTLFMLLLGRWLLPDRGQAGEADSRARRDRRLAPRAGASSCSP